MVLTAEGKANPDVEKSIREHAGHRLAAFKVSHLLAMPCTKALRRASGQEFGKLNRCRWRAHFDGNEQHCAGGNVLLINWRPVVGWGRRCRRLCSLPTSCTYV